MQYALWRLKETPYIQRVQGVIFTLDGFIFLVLANS